VAADASGLWLDVPFVKQEKEGCGAAVTAMVMQYWQKKQGHAIDASADQAHIQQAIFSKPAHGAYASDLKEYLEQHGFRAFSLRGDWDLLQQHLAKGRPLIVALKPRSGDAPLHYVVVAGLDESVVLMNDPAQRKLLKEERSTFQREWDAAGNWTLLAVPSEAR
jgi:ABC-type bacteriocin/lantibiotic exporter with double-glycine peptidase domain